MMSNFYLRFFVSIPIILLSIFFIFLGKIYFLYFISIIFLFLFFEWNFVFYKKYLLTPSLEDIIVISIHTLISFVMLIISLFDFDKFLIISIIYLIYSVFINYKYKFNFMYLIVIVYFLFSLFSTFNFINNINNINLLSFVIILVILFDILSYIFGNIFKGKKIFPKISPGKTISGYLFGFFLSSLFIILLNIFLSIFENYLNLFLFILIILLSSIMGDLIESFIKRKLNIKDISNFLPGHGGFFDRFDSFLFVFVILNLLQLNFLIN